MYHRLTPAKIRGEAGAFCTGVALLAGMACLLSSRPTRAAEPTLSNVSVGIRGHFQVGGWTSFEADVDSDVWPVQLTILVPDPDGNLTRQPAVAIQQPASSPVRVRTLFMAGRLSDTLRVELQAGDSTSSVVYSAVGSEGSSAGTADPTVSFHSPQTAATRFWAILGEAEPFRTVVERILEREQRGRPAVQLIELESADDLPVHPSGLESLELLVVTGSQQVSPSANEAIRRWVQQGGHLIVSIGQPDAYTGFAPSNWMPLRVTGRSRLRDLSALTTQVPGGAPIRVDTVEALQFQFDFGETVASTLDGPLWARLPFGFGQVTFLGVDITRRPLVDWTSLPLLCERLTGYERVADQTQLRTGTQLSQTGVSELQTQLVTGIDQFEQMRKPSNWLAMGMILAYLLAIGPLDYLIVHKLLRRPHWTWITFPVMVLLGVFVATRTAADRNATESLANQVDLVDVDLASGTTRVQGWMAFTSPESKRYDVTARLASSAPGNDAMHDILSRLSWTGIPEAGFRGMYRSVGLDLARAGYEFSPEKDALQGLPVSLWSSAGTTVSIDAVIDHPESIVAADLESEASQLRGTMTNQLNVPLEDWFVAHEGRVYLPQTRVAGAAALKIAPGESLDLADGRRVVPRVLQSYLTGVRRVMVSSGTSTREDIVATRDAYDPLARDPFGTLRIASFFQAGRGNDFTSLTNHALDRSDLSHLLPLGRAVLFCRIAPAATAFSLDGEPVATTDQHTVLRVVLPVRKR